MMAKFRNKPVTVQAWHARDLIVAASNNWADLPKEVIACSEKGELVICGDRILIHAFSGSFRADFDDMIIMGFGGQLYPCKPEIFKEIYEPVD